MGIGSIGSTPSFWQQDQNYWSDAEAQSQASSANNALINAMGAAEISQAKGLASIANGTALKRVNSELTAEIQQVLSGNSTTSSSAAGSSPSSSSPSSAGSTSSAAPAVATGTASLAVGTPLSTLGIPAGGAITINSGGDTTTYASTGSDTVGNLISAINADAVGNAPLTATLNSHGNLVLTSKNSTNLISIGDVYAANIGFGVGNNSFKPTKTTSSSPSTATSAASSSSSANQSSSTSKESFITVASENAGSAASLLSASGVAGGLTNMLV